VSKSKKVLRKVLSGASDANVAFDDLRRLLTALNFSERVRGDHFVDTRADIEEILNLQSIGSKAKAYQAKRNSRTRLRVKGQASWRDN
jgi:hypothetical protein